MPPFRSVSSARSNAALIPHLLRAVPRSARQRLQPTPLHRNSTTTRLSSTRTEPRLVAPSVARSPPPSGPSLETLQRWFFMAFALTTGALFGIIFRETVAPQPLPEPGSEKDAKVLTELEEDIDALDIVKELRGPGREERVMVHPWRPHPHRYSNPQADSAFFGWPAQEKAEEAKERRARKAEERRLRKKEGGRGPLHQDVKLDKLPTPEPQAAEAAAAPNPWIELDPPASGSPTSKPLLPSPPSPSSLSRPERLDSGTPFHSPFSPPNNPSTAATSYIPPSASASTSASKPPSPSSFPTRVPTPYTHSTLPGSRALGHFGPRTVQRTFYNPSTRELVQAVWLGGALSGWPGVVHGGAIATVLGEAGGRCLSVAEAGGDEMRAGRGGGEVAEGVREEAGEAGKAVGVARKAKYQEPKSLSLTYLKPTTSNGFYVLRSRVEGPGAGAEAASVSAETPKPPVNPKLPLSKDLTKQVQLANLGGAGKEGARDVEVVTTLENLEGKVCVKARMTFAR